MEAVKYVIYLILSMALVVVLTVSVKSAYQKNYHAVIDYSAKDHDFDTLYHQQDAEVYFVYQNTGNRPLKITGVETSCGCTIPIWSDTPLQPHEADSFKVVYHTENKGFFVKEVMVYSNSITSPDHLTIRGYVPFE